MSWPIVDGKLKKEFSFTNFVQAIAFVNKVADVAQALDHHPNIHVHSWNKVKIEIFTHSENKITDKDHELANEIDTIK